ncbi:MAG: MarR family transcriptional regulator [Ruminococcus sp.]|nr:MarR family transcriptional regulator [Ruminococcus sp.]
MSKWDNYIKEVTAVVNRTDYLYEKWSKHQNVNSCVSKIMYMLRSADMTTQKEMAECYGMPKQTVNTVISELHKKEYIQLIPDENDKRSKIIKLTDKGEKYADEIVTPLLDCEKKVLAEMGEERVKMMIDTMKQYADLLEKTMREY